MQWIYSKVGQISLWLLNRLIQNLLARNSAHDMLMRFSFNVSSEISNSFWLVRIIILVLLLLLLLLFYVKLEMVSYFYILENGVEACSIFENSKQLEKTFQIPNNRRNMNDKLSQMIPMHELSIRLHVNMSQHAFVRFMWHFCRESCTLYSFGILLLPFSRVHEYWCSHLLTHKTCAIQSVCANVHITTASIHQLHRRPKMLKLQIIWWIVMTIKTITYCE